jgi:hypothetical protein
VTHRVVADDVEQQDRDEQRAEDERDGAAPTRRDRLGLVDVRPRTTCLVHTTASSISSTPSHSGKKPRTRSTGPVAEPQRTDEGTETERDGGGRNQVRDSGGVNACESGDPCAEVDAVRTESRRPHAVSVLEHLGQLRHLDPLGAA